MARTGEGKPHDTSKSSEKGVLSRLLSAVSGESDVDTEKPNAIDLLKSDHSEVRSLFKEYKDASEGAKSTRKRLIDQVSRALDVHAQIEEKIFYPACKALRDEDARRIVGESLEEHTIVKRLIKELAAIPGADDVFEAKATVLQEMVEHHADEEERDLFPVAKRELGEDKLQDLGRRMLEMKSRLSGGSRAVAKSATRKPGRSRKQDH